jgi:hypothetical protein
MSRVSSNVTAGFEPEPWLPTGLEDFPRARISQKEGEASRLGSHGTRLLSRLHDLGYFTQRYAAHARDDLDLIGGAVMNHDRRRTFAA